ITVLASSFSHIAMIWERATSTSVPAISKSKTLPWRMPETPPKPSPASEPSMAWPWGSRTPFLSVTMTRAFIAVFPNSLNQARTGGQRIVVLDQNAEALGDLAIAFHQTAKALAEAVLVELVAGLDVPQAAIVGADLVGQNDAHQIALIEPADLDLEIDELDAHPHEQAGEEVVDADGEAHDVVELGRIGPAESGDVLLGDHGIAQRIVLVVELDDGAGQLRALFETEALAQRAGGEIAHHHLERDDLDLADQLLAHIDAAQ